MVAPASGRRAEDAGQAAYQAFGLDLITDLALPGDWQAPTSSTGRTVSIAIDHAVPHMLAQATLEWAAPIDGGRLTLERGAENTFLFRHQTGRHLLSRDTRTLSCAPTDDGDPAWFRVLLDSVLLCTALLGGREGLHAGSVSIDGGAVAIIAASGGGKSTLLLELMRRGHGLIADDITFLEPQPSGPPLALPGPPVMTLADTAQPLAKQELLMDLPGERWVSSAVVDSPVPLRAIVKLDRRAGAPTQLGTSSDAPQALLAGLLALPLTPERALARLDLAAMLAKLCPVLTLTADLDATPSVLARLVELAGQRA